MSDENIEESVTPDDAKDEETPGEEFFAPDPPEAIEKAERLLQEANLARVRGHQAVADRLLAEATTTAPNSSLVLEAIGDSHVAQGKFRQAKESYARAHQVDPTSKSIENKFGEMVLKVDLQIDPFAHAEEFSGYASPKIAVGLSLICPGLGQFAVERYTKGTIMLLLYAICWVLMGLLPGGFKSVFGFMTGKAQFDPVGGVLLFFALGVLVWSITDLSSLKNKAPKKIDRPVPPVEGFDKF